MTASADGASRLPPTVQNTVEVAVLLQEHQRRWRQGERPTIEDLLAAHPQLACDRVAVVELISSEFLLRQEQGEALTVEDYLKCFPAYAGLGYTGRDLSG
jgi:hypothetical protein